MVSPVQGEVYVNSSSLVTIVATSLYNIEVILENVKADNKWKEVDGQQVIVFVFLDIQCKII